MTGRRSASRLASPAAAFGLAVADGLLGIAACLLSARAHQLGPSTGVLAALGTVTVLVGLVVAARQPANPLGWCLLAGPFLALVSNVASTYSLIDYRLDHGALPLGAVAVVLQPTWAPAIVLGALALFLFPDGALPGGWTRLAIVTILGLSLAWIVGALGISVTALVHHHVRVDGGGNVVGQDHPSGVWAWVGTFQSVLFVALLGGVVLWALQQVPTFRRSAGERRLQLKWLYGGVTVAVPGAVLTFTGNGTSLSGLGLIGLIGVAAVPVAIGVAVLRYRLYEIDRVISRTLSYVLITGLLVGVYAGAVTLATRVLPFSSPVGVAASTLAVVALFSPLRRRVQRFVDRRFNRARYDAEVTLSRFRFRVRGAVDLGRVQAELVDAVHGAFEPALVGVWMRGSEPGRAAPGSPGARPRRPGARIG